jgi:hypothetical protein
VSCAIAPNSLAPGRLGPPSKESIGRMAAMRAVSLLACKASLASSAMASGACARANSRNSAMTRGRPPWRLKPAARSGWFRARITAAVDVNRCQRQSGPLWHYFQIREDSRNVG